MAQALTDAQRELADRRAACVTATAAALGAAGTGFVSVRDTRHASRQAGVPEPDWRAERAMVRAAGFGRLRTAGLLGDWESMVSAADEASRWYHEPLDLIEVSRRSLTWCLADRPDGPMVAVLTLSRDVVTDDVHIERPERPRYRQLLDRWRQVLHDGTHD